MAVQSLKDTVPDSEIVRLGEVKNVPNYTFPDGDYGISGDYRNYSIVKKRISYRTGKEEDGINNGKVIEYEEWKDISCYPTTIHGCFEFYAKILTLTEFKSKKLMSSIDELVSIYKNTYNEINKALACFKVDIDDEQAEICNLIDVKYSLQVQISQLRSELDGYKKISKDIDRMYQEIKDKRTIIVNVDKPKKHRDIKE